MTMRAVILAGGKGTRLAPYTTVFPKPLMPIGEEPILEIVIKQLRHYGVNRITLAVGHLAELIKAYFGDGSRHGVEITYSREDKPLGTAGPLALIPDLDETFLVVNGDLLTTLNFGHLIEYHKLSNAVVTLAAYERSIRSEFGILDIDGEFRVRGYCEKPLQKHRVSMGIYVFNPAALKFLEANVRFDLPDLVLRLMGQDQKVSAYLFDGYWLDIGRAEDYQAALDQFPRIRAQLLHEGEKITNPTDQA